MSIPAEKPGQHTIHSKLSIFVEETLRPKSERFHPVFNVVMNSPEINNHSNIPQDEKARNVNNSCPAWSGEVLPGGLAYNTYHLS